MNKPVYLGLSVLDISKIAIYENWYDYIKPKCKDMTKPCYTEPGRAKLMDKQLHVCYELDIR